MIYHPVLFSCRQQQQRQQQRQHQQRQHQQRQHQQQQKKLFDRLYLLLFPQPVRSLFSAQTYFTLLAIAIQ